MTNLNLGDTVQCKTMDWTGVIDASDNGALRNAKRYHVTNESGSMWFYHDELSTLLEPTLVPEDTYFGTVHVFNFEGAN